MNIEETVPDAHINELPESEIPNSIGGTLDIESKKLSVFCVDDFSIINANGCNVSLLDVARAREVFTEPLTLKGKCVYPFPRRTFYKENPLTVYEAIPVAPITIPAPQSPSMDIDITSKNENSEHNDNIGNDDIMEVNDAVYRSEQNYMMEEDNQNDSNNDDASFSSTEERTRRKPRRKSSFIQDSNEGSSDEALSNDSDEFESSDKPKESKESKGRKAQKANKGEVGSKVTKSTRITRGMKGSNDTKGPKGPIGTKGTKGPRSSRGVKSNKASNYSSDSDEPIDLNAVEFTETYLRPRRSLRTFVSENSEATNPNDESHPAESDQTHQSRSSIRLTKPSTVKSNSHDAVDSHVSDEEPPSSVPFEANQVTVLSLGTIKVAPNYYTKKSLYPVGFKSSRLYTSIFKFEEKIRYISEIREGAVGPLFVVYPEDAPTQVFEGTSASGAWKKVLLRLNDLREAKGIPTTVASVSGPEMYGLANRKVIRAIERLPGARDCKGYVPISWESEIPQGDAKDDESDFELEDAIDEDEDDEGDEGVDEEEEEEEEAVDKSSDEDSSSLDDFEDFVKVKQPSKSSKPTVFLQVRNDSKLRVRCRQITEGYEAVDTSIDAPPEVTKKQSRTVAVEPVDKVRRGRRSEQIDDDVLYGLNMSATYYCNFEVEKGDYKRVTVKVTDSPLEQRNGTVRVVNRMIGVMRFDLKHKEYGHLLQMLYSLRVFQLSVSQIQKSRLDVFLQELYDLPIPAVAHEAACVMRIHNIRLPSKRSNPEDKQSSANPRSKRVKQVEESEEKLIQDENSIHMPERAKQEATSISVNIRYWGIRYHSDECFLFGMGDKSLFILRSTSFQPKPAEAYQNYFVKERLLFESCCLIYRELQQLAEKGVELKYETVMGKLWNGNRNDDVLITEEDLMILFPHIKRELVALDRMKGFAANVNTFSLNDFMTNLEYENKLWTSDQSFPRCVYALHYDLDTAEYRSSQLRSDQQVVEEVNKGSLPRICVSPYPSVCSCPKEDLRYSEWKKMVDVWTFIRSYHDVLGLTDGSSLQLTRVSFTNALIDPSQRVNSYLNAFQILTSFLVNEELKNTPSLRKQYRSVTWVQDLFRFSHFAALCDTSNYVEYFCQLFDPSLYKLDPSDDIWLRMKLLIIQLMRHPDSMYFLHPVDEAICDLPDYRQVVKQPMDFETIAQRILGNWYLEGSEEETSKGKGVYGVVEDIFLIYTNCRKYNGSDSALYRYSVKMADLTTSLLKDWIVPLDASVAELLPQRAVDRIDSDEEAPKKPRKKQGGGRGGRGSESQRKAHRWVLEDSQDEEKPVEQVIDQLSHQPISSLPFADQLTMLHALFKKVLQSHGVMEERERRQQMLLAAQREFQSISTQMVELEAVYAKQEYSLRSAFTDSVANASVPMSQKMVMVTVDYTPTEKSKVPQERALAQFLTKKNTAINDLRKRIEATHLAILNAQQAMGEMVSLGKDRYNREYFWIPDEIPARLWVVDEKADSLAYLWDPAQVDALHLWLDNRGKNEQLLYSALCRCKMALQKAMTDSMKSAVQVSGDLDHLSARKLRDINQSEMFVYNKDKNVVIAQCHGNLFGVKNIPIPGTWAITRNDCYMSPLMVATCETLFVPLFMRHDLDPSDIEEFRDSLLPEKPLTLPAYESLILRLDELILQSISSSYIQPDWLISRCFWREKVEGAETFSCLHYLLGVLKTLAVDFSVIEALTKTTDRDHFLQCIEKQVKIVPRIPNEGESVVYYCKGHKEAIMDFFRNNIFSGIFDNKEKEQEHDCVCKVQRIEYFEGNGNPFLRFYLKPVSSQWLRVLVKSFYSSIEKEQIQIEIDSLLTEEKLGEPFVVTNWLASNQSDFLVPLDKYLSAFSNNIHIKDHFRMWFQGTESTITPLRKKRKDNRVEGSYLHGEVVQIEPYGGDLFPWECLKVEWEGSGTEAGTNHINPWECEVEPRDLHDRRENGRVMRVENHRLAEEDLKLAKKKAMETAASHTKKEGEEFFQFLKRYWEQKGMEVQKPMLSYEELDLGLFWKLMQCYGGYENVVNTKGCWADIHKLLPNFRAQNTSAPTSLHKVYLKYMWQLEKEQREEKGMPPIIEPRLPFPTAPGRSQVVKGKIEEKEEKKTSFDVAMIDAEPGIQFIGKVIKEQEKLRSVLQMKNKTINASMAYTPGTIQTVKEEVKDFAYQGIVYGNSCMIRRQIEAIGKFVSQLKSVVNYYY